MLLAQILGGIVGIAIVWIPVHFYEKREEKRLAKDLEEIRNHYKFVNK
jgi:uncharacterized membrane protein YuzA (DUF378 family)